MRTFHMWCDTGPHFRAYEFLAYWCYTVPKRYKVDTKLSMFCEHHGKGRVDAHFGQLSNWLEVEAALDVIASVSDLVAAWKR